MSVRQEKSGATAHRRRQVELIARAVSRVSPSRNWVTGTRDGTASRRAGAPLEKGGGATSLARIAHALSNERRAARVRSKESATRSSRATSTNPGPSSSHRATNGGVAPASSPARCLMQTPAEWPLTRAARTQHPRGKGRHSTKRAKAPSVQKIRQSIGDLSWELRGGSKGGAKGSRGWSLNVSNPRTSTPSTSSETLKIHLIAQATPRGVRDNNAARPGDRHAGDTP
jgi:hypothetical protein